MSGKTSGQMLNQRPAAAAANARIGPNAITRVAEALGILHGEAARQQVFARAQLLHYLDAPPASMVDETEVQRLHRALRSSFDADATRRLARLAGERTGDYLLAHRIPKPVQLVLKGLPARLAARVLLSAIRRHAWTFAGSGQFTALAGRPIRLAITHCPLCRDEHARDGTAQCDYYAATFERLLRSLVHHDIRVTEVQCEAAGGKACEFEARW
jgi:divinyl protochlorophyllide a 8-vinyl-reductase